MRILIPLLAVALSGTAVAADSNKDLDKALAGRTPGGPIDCIDQSMSEGAQIIDERTILYRSGRHVYRNTLDHVCPSLRPDKILIVELHGSQICNRDHFRVTEPGSVVPGQICWFGKFVPYDKPKS